MADLPPDKTVGPNGKWKVTAVGENVREWSGAKGGQMKSYRVTVESGETRFERVELAQKEATAAPTVGQELDGEVNERHYEAKGEVKSDLKFKKAGAFGGGGGGGGRAWKPRPDDVPEVYASRQAGIIRQHSQNMALRVLELASAGDTTTEAIMEELGVPQKDGDGNVLGLVETFSYDVSKQAGAAWTREAEKQNIAKRLAEVA